MGMAIYSNTNQLEKQLNPIQQRQFLLSLDSALLRTLLEKQWEVVERQEIFKFIS